MNQTKHTLTVVAGPRAIGKTHWIDLMLAEHRGRLARVMTCTTRPKREKSDEHSYVFLTEAEFQDRLDSGWFLETDSHKGFRYGSSLVEIRPALAASHGILALTPAGVQAVWAHRSEINVRVVVFLPVSRAMARRNVERRAIDPPALYDQLADEAVAFRPPTGVDCCVLYLTGDDEIDGPYVRAALAPPF